MAADAARQVGKLVALSEKARLAALEQLPQPVAALQPELCMMQPSSAPCWATCPLSGCMSCAPAPTSTTAALDPAPVLAHVRQCCKAMSWCISMRMQMLAAGIVQLGWTVMAPSQQVQPGAAHASALPEAEQSDSKEDGSGRKPTKKHLWHNYGAATRWGQHVGCSTFCFLSGVV